MIMADEFDVFANSKSAAGGGKEQQPARPAPAKSAKRVHHKNHARQAKANKSPIRGANGEESVNPLLNAPLPRLKVHASSRLLSFA